LRRYFTYGGEMAEAKVFELVSSSIKSGTPVALVTVMEHSGSTPGKQGSVMAVLKSGVTEGSVGGGELEYTVIKQSIDCIKTGESGEFSYDLTGKDGLGMECGGAVKIYVKVFAGADRLIIAGGGHIGTHLYRLALAMHFSITVIDSRDEFATQDRFENAEVICADPGKTISEMDINENTYITIATHSHECDEQALRSSIDRGAAYVGMIGSRRKVGGVFERLKTDGKKTEDIYAPMGLDIASIKPEEIALSIMSEILLIKNSGTLRHMKDK